MSILVFFPIVRPKAEVAGRHNDSQFREPGSDHVSKLRLQDGHLFIINQLQYQKIQGGKPVTGA